MKKIIAICSLALVSVFAPSKVEAQVIWPSAKATSVTIATSGTTALSIFNQMNYVASIPTLTADITVSVTASSGLRAGSLMLLTIKTTSTEVTTFAGAITSTAVTGVAGKTWSQGFIYNGTKFYPVGAKIQID